MQFNLRSRYCQPLSSRFTCRRKIRSLPVVRRSSCSVAADIDATSARKKRISSGAPIFAVALFPVGVPSLLLPSALAGIAQFYLISNDESRFVLQHVLGVLAGIFDGEIGGQATLV